MNLRTQLEEMKNQRDAQVIRANNLRGDLTLRDEMVLDQRAELEAKVAKIKEQADQILWLRQMNQTLTRKIPNYAGA